MWGTSALVRCGDRKLMNRVITSDLVGVFNMALRGAFAGFLETICLDSSDLASRDPATTPQMPSQQADHMVGTSEKRP